MSSSCLCLTLAVIASLEMGCPFMVPGQTTNAARNQPMRILVAGLVHGHVAGFMDAARRRDDIKIVGIAEADTAVAAMYRRRYSLGEGAVSGSLEKLIQKERPEAVVVFSSTFDHRSIVELCSRFGVPVMMEKPLAVSFGDAKAIAKAAETGKIAVLVNYETSWYPNTPEIYRIVHEHRLGEIRKLIAYDGHRGPKEIGVGPEFLSWLTDPVRNGGGALMDFGCYGANLFTYLMDNQRPVTVTAVTQRMKPDVYPRVDDEATILLTYPHAQGIIQASWNWPANRKDLEVFGAAASASSVGRELVRFRTGDEPVREISSAALEPPFDDPLAYLKAVVRGEVRPSGPSTLENNMIVNEILDAARRSAESGQTVHLPPVPEYH